jgi:hypothetical protein
MSKWIARILIVILILGIVGTVNAQYPDPWYSSYQVQNIGSAPADVSVNYYDKDGIVQSEASTQYPQVPPGGSITVLQKETTDNPEDYDDPGLPEGRYSAVIQSTQPIAAIANQQLVPAESTGFNPSAPFSSYTGNTSGSQEVILPVVMANWFGYYTEIFIQNVGNTEATIDISYYPTTIEGLLTGAEGQADTDNIVPPYASLYKNQNNISDTLGAPQILSGTIYIDSKFTGRFLGAAVIKSNQPIVAMVNQHQVGDQKLFTYNGFSSGANKIAAPIYMRNHFGYYASLTIANISLSDTANITLTYTADNEYSKPEENQRKTVSAYYTIPPGESINRYDGQPASPDQSDLNGSTGDLNFEQFFGTVTVESDQPIVAIINQEAIKEGDAQAGTYSALDVNAATAKVSVPLVQANFFAYYTSLTFQSATGGDGEIYVTYTSDDMYSSVLGASKTYTHSIVGAQPLNIYEGTKGGIRIGDINADPAFWADVNGDVRFIGSAIITSTVPIVAFTNEETDISGVDTMYTFNTFNLTP